MNISKAAKKKFREDLLVAYSFERSYLQKLTYDKAQRVCSSRQLQKYFGGPSKSHADIKTRIMRDFAMFMDRRDYKDLEKELIKENDREFVQESFKSFLPNVLATGSKDTLAYVIGASGLDVEESAEVIGIPEFFLEVCLGTGFSPRFYKDSVYRSRVQAKDGTEYSALMLAARFGQNRMMKNLCGRLDELDLITEEMEEEAFFEAIEYGNESVIATLAKRTKGHRKAKLFAQSRLCEKFEQEHKVRVMFPDGVSLSSFMSLMITYLDCPKPDWAHFVRSFEYFYCRKPKVYHVRMTFLSLLETIDQRQLLRIITKRHSAWTRRYYPEKDLVMFRLFRALAGSKEAFYINLWNVMEVFGLVRDNDIFREMGLKVCCYCAYNKRYYTIYKPLVSDDVQVCLSLEKLCRIALYRHASNVSRESFDSSSGMKRTVMFIINQLCEDYLHHLRRFMMFEDFRYHFSLYKRSMTSSDDDIPMV